MSRIFATNIDMNQNQLQNVVVHASGTAPSTPVTGQLWFNTTASVFTLNFYNGTGWVTLGRMDQLVAPNADVSFNSKKITALADPVALTDAATKGYVLSLKVSDLTAPTAAFSMNSQKISNLADPTNPQDAATKIYVDNAIQGVKPKYAAVVRTSTNINLASPGATLDGITMTSGDRVLIGGQTTANQNGIYIWNGAAAAMTRATDADAWSELISAFVFIESGTSADTGWLCSVDTGGTLGTTDVTFVQFSAAGTIGLSNVGSGSQLVAGQSGNTYNIRSIVGSNGIIATQNTNDVTLTVDSSYIHDTAKFAKYYSVINAANQASTTVTHNLNNALAQVQIIETSTGNIVEADIGTRLANSLVVTFYPTPTTSKYTIICQG